MPDSNRRCNSVRLKAVSRPPTIVVSSHTFLPVVGGAELGIHEIYKRIAAKGRRVVIVAPSLPAELLATYGADDYQNAPYTVRRTLGGRGRLLPERLRQKLNGTCLPYLWTLLRVRRAEGEIVDNAHFFRAHGLALPILRLAGIPVILSLVGRSDVLEEMHPLRRLAARLVARSVNEVLPISAYYKRASGSERYRVVPYGVNVSEYHPDRRVQTPYDRVGISPDTLVLLCAQRLVPVKRVDVLIRVLAQLIMEDRDVTLVVVGQGEEDARLRELALDLDVADRVHFAGYVSGETLPAYFAGADVFVFHSMFETFGLVFAQAMASGLPIVAARTSSVPFVVGVGNTLVKPFDVHAFRAAVARFVSDRPLRLEVGEANRRRAVREFDWDVIADEYERTLDTVRLGRRERRWADRHGWGPSLRKRWTRRRTVEYASRNNGPSG